MAVLTAFCGCGLTPAEQCKRTGGNGNGCSGCCAPVSPGSTEYRCLAGIADDACGFDGLECGACSTGARCVALMSPQFGGQCQ